MAMYHACFWAELDLAWVKTGEHWKQWHAASAASCTAEQEVTTVAAGREDDMSSISSPSLSVWDSENRRKGARLHMASESGVTGMTRLPMQPI